jgi:hypothetical protein
MVPGSRIRERTGGARMAVAVFACVLAAGLMAQSRRAEAVPSFATQTGLPCSQCHVVAFGPQLTAYGRLFKLNGYTFKKADGGINIPLAATAQVGYENLSSPAPAPSPYSDKENLYLQDVSAYIAGGFGEHFGSFIKVTYDAVGKQTAWDLLDVRYAHTLELGGHSLIAGIDVNNNPTVQDLWNSTPVWGFPYYQNTFTPFPDANPILKGVGDTVLGGSVYTMIDNLVYAELGFYKGVSDKWLGNLGVPHGDPNIVGAAPYFRVAAQKQAGQHYFELGFTGFWVEQEPYTPTSALANHYNDYALDFSYQFNVGGAHAVDAHASWIHEKQSLDASFALGASDAQSNNLNTLEADAAYILDQTWVASLGLFDTDGTTNHLLYQPSAVFGSASGTPQTSGYRVQLEWIPFGKAGSWASPWVNLRLGLQYTAYWRFNGGSSNYDGFGRSASDNDTLFLMAWLAF